MLYARLTLHSVADIGPVHQSIVGFLPIPALDICCLDAATIEARLNCAQYTSHTDGTREV